jgi:hypothetical protein
MQQCKPPSTIRKKKNLGKKSHTKQNIKHPGINAIFGYKNDKDLYNENYKMLKKQIVEDTIGWKSFYPHGSAK